MTPTRLLVLPKAPAGARSTGALPTRPRPSRGLPAPTRRRSTCANWRSDAEAASGVPAGATRQRDAIVGCDALLIASPEYNVVPQQFALGRAGDAFDAGGALQDPKAAQSVRAAVDAVLRLGAALTACIAGAKRLRSCTAQATQVRARSVLDQQKTLGL